MSTRTAARPNPQDRLASKRSRSGNPAVRSGAEEAPERDFRRDEARPDTLPGGSRGYLLLGVLLIAGLTTGYTITVMFLPWSVESLFLLAMLAVPALITMAFIPQARSTGLYRWPVAWALGFTSAFPVPMLILAQTWVLSRYWLVEYRPQAPLATQQVPVVGRLVAARRTRKAAVSTAAVAETTDKA